MQLISHCHSSPRECPHPHFTLTPTPGCLSVKTVLSTSELKTPLPGHSSMWVCSSSGSDSLCLPSTPWGLFSFRLGSSILPTKQAPFLPGSGFDTVCQAAFLCEHSLHLTWALIPHPPAWRPSSLSSVFNSQPAILHTNTLYTLLGLRHLALGCPLTLDAHLHGHPPYYAKASIPRARPLFCGDGLAWAPVPCTLVLMDTLLPLRGLKHPVLGYASNADAFLIPLGLSHPALGYPPMLTVSPCLGSNTYARLLV